MGAVRCVVGVLSALLVCSAGGSVSVGKGLAFWDWNPRSANRRGVVGVVMSPSFCWGLVDPGSSRFFFPSLRLNCRFEP